MSTDSTIGFLGTGIMGVAMARRLCEAGYPLRAWNRSAEKAERLRASGATIAHSAVEAAIGADVVIVMLSSGPICDEVLLGENGVISAMKAGAALVVMSSIPVETAQAEGKIALACGVFYVDAPVSGGERGAIAGTLAIMAGGDEAVIERLRPVFEVMGRATRIGPIGTGQLAKLANQLIVATTVTVVAEALTFAELGGADPAKVCDALRGGFADSTILQNQGRRMIERNFAPGGPAKYQLKDSRTMLDFAAKLGLELPVGQMVDSLFADLVAHGDGDLDHTAILRELRRRNKLPPE